MIDFGFPVVGRDLYSLVILCPGGAIVTCCVNYSSLRDAGPEYPWSSLRVRERYPASCWVYLDQGPG